MPTSTTEAEYVAAASGCGQVLWIQNQLLDYGYNFMNNLLTKPFDAGRFQYLVCKLFLLLGKLSTVSVFLGFELTSAGTFTYWVILRILMISPRLIPLDSMVNMCINFLHGSDSQRTHEFIHVYLASASVQYTRRTKIAQSLVLSSVTDEPASPLGDNSQCEACPTNSGFVADQDRANIAKTSTLPSDSAPRRGIPYKGEGSRTPTESHHTPTSEASQSSQHELSSPSLPPIPTESLPTVIPSDNPPLRQYTRRTK
nr:ribonuclease H-like domain, reverse transcriptase, RNA-dependent DNA polymerase [Tanacetum cinerariifolium]